MMPPTSSPAQDAGRDEDGRRTKGNLAYSDAAELELYACLNGLMWKAHPREERPVHCPAALRPSPFPRQTFEHGRDVICHLIMQLLDAAARDTQWLREIIEPAAVAQYKAEGDSCIALKKFLELLDVSRQPLMLNLMRTDYMLSKTDGKLRHVETNTISSAGSSAMATMVAKMHRHMLARDGKQVDPVPMMESSVGIADALAFTHRHMIESTTSSGAPSSFCTVFVVLEEEYMLYESLIEQDLRARHGIHVEALTMQGCAERLTLGEGTDPAPLLLDSSTMVTVVYFRGGIECRDYSTEERWAAQRLIERSSAVKTPSAGMRMAGTKVAQAALAKESAIDRFLPNISKEHKQSLLDALTPCSPVGDVQAEEAAIADPSKFILKKEPLGIWAGDGMVEKIQALRKDPAAPMCDHLIMEMIQATEVPEVCFVREGRSQIGPGMQEVGYYGACLSDGSGQPLLKKCLGYLVRTKVAHEANGGIAKGTAVFDSLYLVD